MQFAFTMIKAMTYGLVFLSHSVQFSNLLGAVYRKGNLEFFPDGFKVASPVGNRISVFDLKK